MADPAGTNDGSTAHRTWLFWACFVALVATSFAFGTRAAVIAEWARDFGLSETQKGEINGVGMWPFAISIVLFSLVIDRVGYGRAMIFAFVCHVGFVVLALLSKGFVDSGAGASAGGYWMLYAANFIVALGNGTVEAVINPAVASMFPNAKTKWLNILHAGWPGGIVLGGLLALSLGEGGLIGARLAEPLGWEWKVGLILVPTLIYGVMMLRARFPVSERITAGVSYRDMLRQPGIIGMFLIVFLIVMELTRVFLGGWFESMGWGGTTILLFNAGVTLALLVPYAIYVRGVPGRWLFIVLLVLMIPLATTELGTDQWIKDLMKPVLERQWGIDGLWVLIYSATIMMVLRFSCGPLTKVLSPLGILAIGSAFAAAGLASLSQAAGWWIIGAATIYGIGQTFFWPTTLGLVAERFPSGGALTLNAVAGVGMLGVGIIGTVLIGNIQDHTIDRTLATEAPALHAQVAGDEKLSVFGPYRALDPGEVAALDEPRRATLTEVQDEAKQGALLKVAAFPLLMLAVYVGLIIYFKTRGGYRPVDLNAPPSA